MMIPPDVVSLGDYARHFTQRAPQALRAFVDGAAADGLTRDANRAAFNRLRLRPRVLRDLAQGEVASSLLGLPLPHPVLLAPVAYHKLVHPEGECATAQGAGSTGAWMVVSAQASCRLEDIAAHARAPLVLQLYWRGTREATLRLVRRAEEAGFRAVVLTVDAPVNGTRNDEQRAGFRLPAGISAVNLEDAPTMLATGGDGSIFSGLMAQAPRWADVAWLAQATPLPLLLKGILDPTDAVMALDAGAAGLIVSNHGGRTLDTLPASLEALPAIAEAVGGRIPLLLDGGIRRGTDILKALALGARAVLVGRPQMHALALAGPLGVAHMLSLLRTELEVAMALTGHARLESIDRSALFTPPAFTPTTFTQPAF